MDSIIDGIFSEDARYLRAFIKSRRKTGLILSATGMGLIIVPLVVFLMFPTILLVEDFMKLLGYIWGLMIVGYIGVRLVQSGILMWRTAPQILNPGAGRYRFMARLECPKCGFTLIRERRKDEYVGLVVDDRCGKCMESMRITGIYAEPERKIKPVGYLLMPLPSQSIMLALKATILSILAPLKLALRVRKKEQ